MSTAAIFQPVQPNLTGVNNITSATTSDLTLTGGTNKNIVLSAAGTGAVQINSTTAGGLQIYNTADKVTDYERLEILWASNLATIRTVKGGTGTVRDIVLGPIGGTAGKVRIGPDGAASIPALCFADNSSFGLWLHNSAGNALGLATGTNTQTSGSCFGVVITPIYNQASGTAANTDLLINRTQTLVGSGTQRLIDLQVGSVTMCNVDNAGNLTLAGSTVNYMGAAGAATTSTRLRKVVTGIANAVATNVLTVTIPNAAHSATLTVYLTGSLGAGGAIGANEASAAIAYSFVITRTAGVATVTTASTAFGSAAAAVAGAATVTITAAATAMTGAVGAQQTFTVQVTISRSGGSSTNHTCQVTAEIDNANATGITIA